ncbi:MAG: dihydroorotate dehydrogenase, partial [Thermoplasmata archaeon]|nr:dihydroorotate dehydrogenase [Thermoplasmata archaeon]
AKGLGLELGHDASTVRDIVSAVKNSVSIPVFTKLTPMLPDIGGMAEVVQDAGGDCIVAINTIRAMKIDTELGMPVLKNKCGGLSGPAIKSIGVRCVYEVASKVDIPVVGVGGICSGEDAVEYMMAGASAVQVGSGVHYGGISVFRDICRDIDGFLERHGHGSVKDIIGLAQRC